MESFLSRHKNMVVLTAVIFAQVILLATQVHRTNEQGESVQLFRSWMVAIISPFEKGFVHTQHALGSTWHDYFYLRGVREENEQLKRELEQMKVEQVRLREDANQARRIQYLLGFKEKHVAKSVAAQVIGTSGSETSRLIYLDKGADSGIKPNLPVITPDGVVGKVLTTTSTTSKVLEITDQTSGVGAVLEKSRLQGILKGTATGELTLSYIMADEKVEPGELVVTSGGDRIFPKGMPIGTVASVNPGRDMFLNIRVKPAAQINKVEEVLVLTEVVDKEPDTKDAGPIRAADILAERLPTVPPKNEAPPATQPATNKPAGSQPATTANPAGVRTGKDSSTKSATNAGATTMTPKSSAGAASGPATSAPQPKPAAQGTAATGGTTAVSGGAGTASSTPKPKAQSTTPGAGATAIQAEPTPPTRKTNQASPAGTTTPTTPPPGH